MPRLSFTAAQGQFQSSMIGFKTWSRGPDTITVCDSFRSEYPTFSIDNKKILALIRYHGMIFGYWILVSEMLDSEYMPG